MDEKPKKNILIHYIGHVMIKDSKYVNINSVNPLYLIFSNMNGYLMKINKNKYLTPVSTDESKEIIKKHEELWNKIRDFIRSMTKNSDDCDEKYMKTKFNSDDKVPLNKTIEIPGIIVARAIFLENN